MSKQPNPDPPKCVRPEPPPGPERNWQIQAHEYVWGVVTVHGPQPYDIPLGLCGRCGYPEHDAIHAVPSSIAKPASEPPDYPPRVPYGWPMEAHEYIGYNLASCLRCGKPESHAMHGAARAKKNYPRCATCKHYRTKGDSSSGECSEATVEDDGRPWFYSIGAYNNDSAILVSADFGCVLHSEITG